MPQNYFAAVQVAKGIAFSTVSLAVSAVGVGAQLNQTHAFLYMELPLWYFYIAMVILSFVGALWSMFTDTMQARGNPALKLIVAFTVGIVASFVVLPVFASEPPVAVMLFISLAGSFSGTVLLFLIADVLNDNELRQSIIAVAKQAVLDTFKSLADRVRAIAAAIFKGGA